MKKNIIILFIFFFLPNITFADIGDSFYIINGKIYLNKKEVVLIGANIAFWNKRWEKATENDLQNDLKLIKKIGNCARIFVPYGDEKEGYFGTLNVRKDFLRKLIFFADEAKKDGIAVIVCFLFIRYDQINTNQIFVKQVIDKLAYFRNVIYDIQNEPDLEAQYIPERRPIIVNWCNQMAEFIKNNDPGHHLVTIGFSGIDMIVNEEISLNNVDIISFHIGGKVSPFILKNRVLRLRGFLKKKMDSGKPIAIEEIGISSNDFNETARMDLFRSYINTAKSLDIPIYLWWVLRDIPKDPNAIDGDKIWLEPHRWGIFETDGKAKRGSTEVAITFGMEATKLKF